MKFTVSSQALKEAVATANAAVASNAVLPIAESLNCVLEDGVLTVTGTNLETFIQAKVDVEMIEAGSIAIPAKLLLSTLKTLPTQPITIKADLASFGIAIETENGQFQMVGEDSDDFPKLPPKGELQSFEMEASVLSEAILKTVWAASSDALRPSMIGVLFEMAEDVVTLVATDAHKLVRYKVKGVDLGDMNANFLPPAVPLKALANNMANEVGEVTISFNQQQVFFDFGKQSFVLRLIDHRYPDWKSVMPKANDREALVDRKQIMQSLKRVTTYANKVTNTVKLDFNDSDLTISAEDVDLSNKAAETIAVEFGQKLSAGFNGKYLVEAMNSIDADEVKFEMESGQRPALLSPTEQVENIDQLILLMPVILH